MVCFDCDASNEVSLKIIAWKNFNQVIGKFSSQINQSSGGDSDDITESGELDVSDMEILQLPGLAAAQSWRNMRYKYTSNHLNRPHSYSSL